jgi:hypothetical protein
LTIPYYLEHIGDLPSIIEQNQKDTDYYEVESADDRGNPISVKETANQFKRRMIAPRID